MLHRLHLSHDIYSDETGYVLWRRGTGDNVELTHLYAWPPRRGHGRRLLVRMLETLRTQPPYATVYGFTRYGHRGAQDFYAGVGFTLSYVEGVYGEGYATLFSCRYDELLALHGLAPLAKEAT